ncbi:zinc ribbon domain-containing protein [Clostridium ihumii]|uniref:zinc ribbon domain-containing protein n=1 Tax=Clostridium ihumii TaxID=1470356 RepID=UPI003D334337
MFFIGIFGIENKNKEIRTLYNISCKKCNKIISGKLLKSYNFFHFFFIPLFKWNENYYIRCYDCNTIYSIPKEKGKSIEKGENIEITYWDLHEVNTNEYYYENVCKNCGRDINPNFEYCPHCGSKIKN